MHVIVVRGGLHDGDPTLATVGGTEIERGFDETFAAFEARVTAAAEAAGAEFVVIGGLP
jgi:hypothetical protein